MDINIKKTYYKDIEALSIESSSLKAMFTADPGGKMVSLYNKNKKREYLVQRSGNQFKQQPYDGIYVNGECSGFDDMFPTIDECFYERYPWKGIRVPDHGEVWSLKWHYRIDNQSIIMSVHGIRLPYLLEKEVLFIKDNTIRIKYRLKNLSPFEMDFLWAAHIMLNIEPDDKILLPDKVESVNTILSKSGRMGNYGDTVKWPEFISKDGKIHRADIVRGYETDDMEKYYIKGKLTEGYCGIKNNDGSILGIGFPVDKVPYLGILLNEGAWEGIHNIFIEPCSATFDRIDMSRLRGESSKIGSNTEYRWHLDFIID